MKTEVYLVRHGETEWNIVGRYQGCTDTKLSENGLNQASLLSERFKHKFDYLYTSPLERAYQTAQIIGNASNIDPVISKALIEINFGVWEGLTMNEISKQYPTEYKHWRTDEETARLMSTEVSIKKVSIRAKNEIERLVKMHSGSRIFIVSHGGILKAALVGLFDWKMTMYHRLLLGNTSVSKIQFDHELNPTIITINDTSHLPS